MKLKEGSLQKSLKMIKKNIYFMNKNKYFKFIFRKVLTEKHV
jgi:hypothetical protein